eukprot:gene13012-7745_t
MSPYYCNGISRYGTGCKKLLAYALDNNSGLKVQQAQNQFAKLSDSLDSYASKIYVSPEFAQELDLPDLCKTVEYASDFDNQVYRVELGDRIVSNSKQLKLDFSTVQK